MKSILFSLIFLFIPKLCFSQTSSIDRKVYLDSSWNETTSENYKYYRIIKDYYFDKDLYAIKDFYKSGVLQMEGTSKTKNDISREGEFIFYYENGNKKAVSNYKKGRPNGSQSEWYEDGNKKLEGEYIQREDQISSEFKYYNFWNTKNTHKVIYGNGDYEDYYGKSFSKGKIKNGSKDGIWESYSSNTQISYTDKYENGKFISGVGIDSDNVEHKYDQFEVSPKPKKGIQDFYNYIGNNFKYSRESIRNKVKGKIFIQFVIDNKGKIIEPKILKGLGYGLDEEAIRVITNYENWIPGEQRGNKVRVLYSIPLSLSAS